MDDKFFTCDDCLGILENEESDDEEFIRALAFCVNEGIESARKLIRSDMSESMKRAAMKINQYFAYAEEIESEHENESALEDSEDNQDDNDSDFAPEDSVDGDSTEVPVPIPVPVRENGEEND